MTSDVVEVTQADRDALADYYVRKGMDPLVAENLVTKRDARDDFLQLLARHRLAPTPAPAGEVSALQARVDQLERALEPFAHADFSNQIFRDTDPAVVGTRVTVGDFRRARSALTPT